MNPNYLEILNDLKKRSNPENIVNKRAILEKAMFSDSSILPYSDITEYIKLAMVGVPQEYTLKSKEAAKKVIEHLKKSHGSDVEFKFQGSVETNTHILSENDIDLVQVTSKSNSVDRAGLTKALNESHLFTPSEVVNLKKHSASFSQYQGNQMSDLRSLRIKSENVLSKAYKDVDISKPKAICVNVKSPLRNVDVVTAVDYKTVNYMKKDVEYRKGIQIYDKEKDSKLPLEYPFWSIKRINERDIITDRRLKKMIRFLKNIKSDGKKIIGRKPLISSFDINAICYNIPVIKYQYLHYLELVPVLYQQISKIIDDEDFRNNLKSVDGEEFIFKDNQGKVEELQFLKNAVEKINLKIKIQKLLAI
ncbi:hypothetical protein [Flavobacterium sp. FlaQc-50]|jgi:hypothetical protein|uniref:hypothetical protein n=1 Tax=unclassified Flavobacterium TaxID=196869 RepID=UPI003757C13E